MEIRKYVEIIWRWAWLLALGTGLAGVSALIFSLLQVPVYQASATLLISEAPKGNSSDYTAILTSQQLASTYVQLLTTRPVLDEVIARLRLTTTPKELGKTLTVQLVRNTQLIKVSAESPAPALAAAVANTVPEVFRDSNQAMQTSRYAESKKSLTDEIARLDQSIADTQAQIQVLGQPISAEKQTQLDRLTSDLTQLRQSRTGLLQSYETLRLTEAQLLNNVVIVEAATTPTVPIRPRTAVNTALAAVVGLLLALGAAFLVEYLDDTVKAPDQATALLNLPVIGVVARLSKDELSRGPIAKVEPRSPAAEAFRSLRTNLQFSSIDRPLRRLLVTSTGPGEGKSTVVANLATVFAQAGQRVVVLDADLRRPSLHKQFGLPRGAGLSELMLHEPMTLNGALQATDAPNLSLLLTGVLPPNPAELLGSQKMKTLLDRVNEQADLIILDSPPASAVSDAAILAGEVDGVILVIEVGRTRAGAALHTKAQLERVGANLLGIVLNKAPIQRGGYYYHNYYYYYYPQYASDEADLSGNGRRPFPLNWLPRLKQKRKKAHGSADKKPAVEPAQEETAVP